ncbi:hypothetical protein K505DRAFT_338611 [Melanomma pulvis-pyrius CBS 109.77]|uniref:F-box domain-containing protein n=1 Tax=Melanomma pulvis-pyrius CBS 109.77 TaxID=1314802 RepID=A0A6A6X890_9PLEO|nr:hypothetical protein K505DRAFT_338611 [Melanomma pulvis-pyrius CBS 109.77]
MSSDIATRKSQRDVESDENARHVSHGGNTTKVMADVTTCCAKANHFRFLDLLPELRNRVYYFAFESTAAHIRPYRPYTVIQTAPSIRKRRFYGLTQVCRQIREEFRPIYMEENEVHINPDYATRYIETFFSLLSSDDPEAKKLLGNFALDLDVPQFSCLSLIPLLQLILDALGVKWKFTGPEVSSITLLNRLFCSPGSIAMWESHIQEPIAKLML